MSNSFDIDYESIVNHLGVPPNDGLNYHIFPLSAFNLLDPIDFAIATCPENHQWLEEKKNLYKSAKYKKKELEE